MVEGLDTVLKTIADPTRRAVLEAILKEGEISVGALVQRFDVSQPAISQHLKKLHAAGLVTERKEGRNVHYRSVREGLAPVVDWFSEYRIFWPERFTKLRKLLKEMDQ
jgi:DNA-binding transcriptional ArsR family regulator